MAGSTSTTATARLVAAARAGDQTAFAALIERYYPMVAALCARVLGDGDRALDVAQEAAVTAMLSLDRLREDERFGAWLAGIGLNVCRRLVRDRDWAAFSLDAMAGEPADEGRGPAEAAEAAELAQRVRAAIDSLPAGQRQAAQTYYLSGLTTAEAAVHLGIPVSAVKTRLHKARAALRASLTDYEPERHTTVTEPDMIPVTISGVVQLADGTAREQAKVPYFIRLAETGGQRLMWIGVGRAESFSLALTLAGRELPRPLTYQFTAALLAAAGGRLREVRVTRLTDEVFFAQAVLTSGAVVDCRPSDALNLAALSQAPVYAAPELLDLPCQAAGPEWIPLTLEAEQAG
jgi:RNA polymerase sigma factor (sigma-70 family)